HSRWGDFPCPCRKIFLRAGETPVSADSRGGRRRSRGRSAGSGRHREKLRTSPEKRSPAFSSLVPLPPCHGPSHQVRRTRTPARLLAGPTHRSDRCLGPFGLESLLRTLGKGAVRW